MKGPFEAAIASLNKTAFELGEKFGEGKEGRDIVLQDMKEIAMAHRVLEAAGKVDKYEAIKWLNGTCHSSATTPSMANWIARNHEQIRALLESLPEPEEERK